MSPKPKYLEVYLHRVLNSFIALGLIGLALVVIYNALLRFLPFASSQMAWTEEIGRLLLLWVAFVGAGAITREEKHFVIDLFIHQMGPRVRFFWQVFCDLLMIGFLILLAWETVPIVLDQMDQLSSGAVGLPLGIFPLSLLVGTFIMIFYVFRNAAQHLRTLRSSGRDGRNK